MNINCFKCGKPKEPHRLKNSYCLKCHGEFSAKSRKKKPYSKFSEKRKVQQRCRIKVYQALKSGKLVKKPCEACGGTPSEAHHEDYSKPLAVKWLCKPHHLEAHRNRPKKKPEIKNRCLVDYFKAI